MGVLDWIFGTRSENEDAYAARLNETASREPTLEDVPAFNRPMSSSDQDTPTGRRDELGRTEYRTVTGQTYFLDWQPDQRTNRMVVEDDILPAIEDYAADPYLPSAGQVGQFAKDVATDTYDTVSRTVRGQGTLGDLYGTASMVGAGGMALSENVGEGAVGMFLNNRARNVDLPALDQAKQMAADGVDRDTIWKDTGWGWYNGEWLTEIPDNKSEIAAVGPYRDRGYTTVTETVPGTLSQQDRISARVEAQRETIAIRQRLEAGEIDQEEAVRQAQDVERRLAMNLADNPTREVTRQVPVPAPYLLPKGTLDEVLFHDRLYDAIPEGISMPTAEAGRRTAASAGSKSNIRGEYYPRINGDALLESKDISRISSYRPPEAPKAPAQLSPAMADAVWSTALHETQHFMDDVTKSTSGTGFNADKVSEVKKAARNAVDDAERAIWNHPDNISLTNDVASILGYDIDPDVVYDMLDRTYRVASYSDPDEAAKTLNTFIQMRLPEQYAGKSQEVMAVLTAPRSDVASLMDKITELRNSRAYRLQAYQDYDIYRLEGGEVKARLTQARRNMTEEERRNRPFWYDFAAPDVNVDPSLIFADTDYQGLLAPTGPYAKGASND